LRPKFKWYWAWRAHALTTLLALRSPTWPPNPS